MISHEEQPQNQVPDDMHLILSMLAASIARFEGIEFCFNGLRYSHDHDWTRIMNVIGRDKAKSALKMARTKF